MKRKLTTQERCNLTVQHKKERDKRVCDRIKAVLAYDDGYTYSEISRLLLLDDETLRRHVEDYFLIHKLKPENGGSTGYLSEYQIEHLKAHLHKNTYLYVKDICAYVEDRFDLRYSVSGMTKWLVVNGFRYKKPQGIPSKADAEKQKSFIEYYHLLKAGLPANEVIYFADSSHPQHQTRLSHGWIAKGVRK